MWKNYYYYIKLYYWTDRFFRSLQDQSLNTMIVAAVILALKEGSANFNEGMGQTINNTSFL